MILFSAVAALCCLCVARPVWAAEVLGWGTMAVSSGDFAGSDFVSIASGRYHNLALRQDGSIVGFGRNDYGQAVPPDGNDFTAVAAGGWHGLALCSDGSIVGWGGNDYGQATPPEGNDLKAIAAGGSQSLALKQDGR